MNSLLAFFIKGTGFIFLIVICLYSPAQAGNLKAVNDTIDLYPGIPLVYNILANDTISASDSIRIIAINGAGHVLCQKVHGAVWVFTFSVAGWGFGGELHGGYKIYTMSMDTSSAQILFRIHDKSYAYLDINNVNARFSSSSDHFFGENAEFEVPKGSGKTSIFSNTFWIGGKDAEGALHLAGERYRQGPYSGPAGTKPDFYAGPVMDSTKYSIYQDTVWNYMWNLKKTEIDYHKAHYLDPGYHPIHDILTWPGNGDVSLGEAPKLAPFFDRNNDGIYNPLDGDYPEIRGDQALFFIFNDDRGYHNETMGKKLRVEIHGMAYAFDMPEDTAMKNTVFLNYRLYNRSQNTYDSTLLGIFTDIDLGYAADDYVGCDVERNMYFGYNGTPVDGTGQPNAYGANPPVQSVTLLGGPTMDPDGIDNPRFAQNGSQLCDFSVNGLNFGDSVVDNERYGLQRFVYTNNAASGVPVYMQDPLFAADYYMLMCGKWRNGTPIMYGGNGNPSTGGYGPACRFMYPGESDTLNWGVGCVPPNGPKLWNEETAGNAPGDRRGLGVTGPITFKPGDVQDVDIAFGWVRDYNNPQISASVSKLRIQTDRVNKAFAANRLPNGNLFYGINDHPGSTLPALKTYPNPASGYLKIEFGSDRPMANSTIDLVTLQGNVVQQETYTGNRATIRFDIDRVPSGFYLIRIKTKDALIIKKIVIIH